MRVVTFTHRLTLCQLQHMGDDEDLPAAQDSQLYTTLPPVMLSPVLLPDDAKSDDSALDFDQRVRDEVEPSQEIEPTQILEATQDMSFPGTGMGTAGTPSGLPPQADKLMQATNPLRWEKLVRLNRATGASFCDITFARPLTLRSCSVHQHPNTFRSLVPLAPINLASTAEPSCLPGDATGRPGAHSSPGGRGCRDAARVATSAFVPPPTDSQRAHNTAAHTTVATTAPRSRARARLRTSLVAPALVAGGRLVQHRAWQRRVRGVCPANGTPRRRVQLVEHAGWTR